MDLQACTETLRERVGAASGLEATLKFHCGDDGVVHIDGITLPNVVGNADADAQCTVHISLENLGAMLRGELDPTTGFMTGRLRVEGDLAVALKMQRLVG